MSFFFPFPCNGVGAVQCLAWTHTVITFLNPKRERIMWIMWQENCQEVLCLWAKWIPFRRIWVCTLHFIKGIKGCLRWKIIASEKIKLKVSTHRCTVHSLEIILFVYPLFVLFEWRGFPIVTPVRLTSRKKSFSSSCFLLFISVKNGICYADVPNMEIWHQL